VTDIEDIKTRAQHGDARALGELGRRLLTGDGLSPAPREAIAALRRAEQGRDVQAIALLSRLAAWGVFELQNMDRALDLLASAAALGWRDAQAELHFLARGGGDDWDALRHAVDVPTLTSPQKASALCAAPKIRVIEGFASPAECEWIIARRRSGMSRAQVHAGSAALKIDNSRTNSEAGYLIDTADIVLALIRSRISNAICAPGAFFEVAKLLHYEPGQQFNLHSDFIEPKSLDLQQSIVALGQRIATFLIYLNDDYEGGETDFPKVGIRFKGKKGDALFFLNVGEYGAPDYNSVHAGLPPMRGEKWLFSQWVRSQPLNAFCTPGPLPPPLGPAWLRAF
jgi:prolyl 4-hydroxylase